LTEKSLTEQTKASLSDMDSYALIKSLTGKELSAEDI